MKLVFNLDLEASRLFDLSRPYLPGGEPGQRLQEEAATSRLSKAYEAHVERSRAVRADLVLDTHIDQEDALEKLRALGYLQ